MYILLPYPDFEESAKTLDRTTIRDQIRYGYDLLRGRVFDFHNPFYLMWYGYEGLLTQYVLKCIEGYNWWYHGRTYRRYSEIKYMSRTALRSRKAPPWLGDTLLHLSHRVCLARKDKEFYKYLIRTLKYDVQEYPKGLYWPIEPFGKKAIDDRRA